MTSFLDPWADRQDTGWQIIQSLYAIGSGGLFGVGLRAKHTKIQIYI
ncbi:MAG: FtsW/RodA/SpoVE family cell cycle protein [Oscillospiraceae bacterium]|nr:FtsW/RodA/SpoVE family cell cycle protein [Oscillospiraceae bacterium]